MREQDDKMSRIIKKVITKMLDQEKRGWPPGCAGFYYQPERPQAKCNKDSTNKVIHN